MTQTRRTALKLLAAASAAAIIPARAFSATTHTVLMISKDPDDPTHKNFFSPNILQIAPGDTVNFVPNDKGHNSVSDKNMLPQGIEGWKGKISNEVSVTFDAEGTYGYFCQPHRSLGMVGLVLVGDPSGNYEAARSAKQRGKAKKAFQELFEKADGILNG